MNKSKSKSKSKTKFNNFSEKEKSASNLSNNPLNKTSSKSRKISQKKMDHSNKNKDYLGSSNLLSPKTIEYSKIVEKYGNFLNENSPKNQKNEFEEVIFQCDNKSYKKKSRDSSLKNTKSNSKYKTINQGISDDEKSPNNGYKSKLPNSEKYTTSNYDSMSNLRKIDPNQQYQQLNSHNVSKYSEKLQKYEMAGNQTVSDNLSSHSAKQKVKEILNHDTESKIKSYIEENESLREENLNLKRLLEKERNKSYRLEDEMTRGNINLMNISELEKLKDKIIKVEKENEELKNNKILMIQNTQEKINLFLKLNRKYIKKIKNIVILFSKMNSDNLESINENRESLIDELNSTLEKFNITIHNPKLVSSLLEISNEDLKLNSINTKRLIEETDPLKDPYLKNELSFIDTIKKLENQLKKLSDENNSLLNFKIELQAQNDELKEHLEEMNKLKRKLNDEKLSKDELDMSLKYVKQMNKDLETKMSILEEENSNLKKQIKSANDKLKEFDLVKNKKINFENELKYKESIINYLETLLKSNKINYTNKVLERDYQKEFNINEEDEVESDYDFTRSKFSNKYKKHNSSKERSKVEENDSSKLNNYHMEYKDYKDHRENNLIRNHERYRDKNIKLKNNFSLRDSFTKSRGEGDKSFDEDRLKPSSYLTSSLEKELNIEKNYKEIYSDIKDLNGKKENLDINKSPIQEIDHVEFNSFRNKDINKDNKDFNSSKASKTANLKNEIDSLDSEIKHLQNKLKIMIDVNKK